MPRDGTGQYNLPTSAVVTNTPISSTDENTTRTDIATALTNSIAKDGQTIPTANLPMGTYKHTNVGTATAANEYATLGQTQAQAFLWGGTAGGTANAITLALAPAITTYSAGLTISFLTGAAANSGAVTLAVNGLAALAVNKGNGTVALAAGDLPALHRVTVQYDGTRFVLVSVASAFGQSLAVTADAAAARAALVAPALPTTSAGVGQFVFLNPSVGVGLQLPAGGSWAYFALRLNVGVVVTAVASVAAGGSVVGASAGGENWVGFCWRIA